MKTILFLTASYPYLPGEQFIEDEIPYWANLPGVRVILVPMVAQGNPRPIPQDILIDLTLAKSNKKFTKLKYALKALRSPILIREIAEIKNNKKPIIISSLVALKTVTSVICSTDQLRRICQKWGHVNLAYCYWNDVQAYAATILKKEMVLDRVVSRAHGFDLYEARRGNSYMPLKRQFINGLDFLLAISRQGADYAKTTYGMREDRVLLSRLGVPLPGVVCRSSAQGSINIISVSFCVQVKRLDKIILALRAVAELQAGINFKWVHIGGGPLLEELRKSAATTLTMKNVNFEFLGMLPNAEVKNYFAHHDVDIFINTSESEGVPVSIMEAMSYGVPAIAPNVGGIAEIIDDSCGKLLSENPNEAEIAGGIVSMMNSCKNSEFRSRANKKIADSYSADLNYRALVSQLI